MESYTTAKQRVDTRHKFDSTSLDTLIYDNRALLKEYCDIAIATSLPSTTYRHKTALNVIVYTMIDNYMRTYNVRATTLDIEPNTPKQKQIVQELEHNVKDWKERPFNSKLPPVHDLLQLHADETDNLEQPDSIQISLGQLAPDLPVITFPVVRSTTGYNTLYYEHWAFMLQVDTPFYVYGNNSDNNKIVGTVVSCGPKFTAIDLTLYVKPYIRIFIVKHDSLIFFGTSLTKINRQLYDYVHDNVTPPPSDIEVELNYA